MKSGVDDVLTLLRRHERMIVVAMTYLSNF